MQLHGSESLRIQNQIFRGLHRIRSAVPAAGGERASAYKDLVGHERILVEFDTGEPTEGRKWERSFRDARSGFGVVLEARLLSDI